MGTQKWLKSTSALVCATVSLSACLPHVQLPEALPRTAPAQARVAQYTAFRPQELTTTVVVSYNGGTSMSSQVRLANGLNVYYAEDLLPLAGPGSLTADRVATAQTLETVSTATTIGSVVAAGFGAVAIVAGPSAFGWSWDTSFNVGIGTLIVGALLGATGGITRYIAGHQRRDAFAVFDDSFRTTLGLCLTPSGPGDCAPSPLPINSAPPVSGGVTVSPLSRSPISTPVPMLRF